MDLAFKRFFVSIVAAGLAGLIGTFVAIVFIGGAREATVLDKLTLVQWGGLPAATATFWLCARVLMLKNVSLLVVAPLFVGVQLCLPPFFRQVVRSDLSGNQGVIVVVAVLSITAAIVVWQAPPAPSRKPSERALSADSAE
jgi:hypothetical protein